MDRAPNVIGGVFGAALVVILALPLIALAMSAGIDDVRAGIADPSFGPAVWLSLRTTLVSVLFVVVTGTPLAWWIASSRSRVAQAVELLVELPIVIPPAVIGVALLQTYGKKGLLGPSLDAIGISLPSTEWAVIMAQVVVAAPFFVQAAANAFRKVDPDVLLVARSLGASRFEAFVRVAVPTVLPGLIVGASLAWARALGEFGATLLFAGNRPGVTQTMPLAIVITALETNVRLAVVFSLVLTAMGAALLLVLRLVPRAWIRLRQSTGAPQDAVREAAVPAPTGEGDDR